MMRPTDDAMMVSAGFAAPRFLFRLLALAVSMAQDDRLTVRYKVTPYVHQGGELFSADT